MRDGLPKPGGYYDALGPLCSRLEIWHTIYNHVLEDAAAIVEWVKGTGLRPFVDPLEPPERKQYRRRIHRAHRGQLSATGGRQGAAAVSADFHLGCEVGTAAPPAFASGRDPCDTSAL